VAERAGSIALQTHQQIVGVVENMSWWEQPDGTRVDLFGSGGGAAVAESLSTLTGAKVPLLGQVPIDQRLREGGDTGVPIMTSAPDSPAARAIGQIADRLAARQRGLAGLQLGLSPVGRR
jgi:ATP-binding protein involved in chromosome partitioning